MVDKFFNPDVEVVDMGSFSMHDLKRAEQKEEKIC